MSNLLTSFQTWNTQDIRCQIYLNSFHAQNNQNISVQLNIVQMFRPFQTHLTFFHFRTIYDMRISKLVVCLPVLPVCLSNMFYAFQISGHCNKMQACVCQTLLSISVSRQTIIWVYEFVFQTCLVNFRSRVLHNLGVQAYRRCRCGFSGVVGSYYHRLHLFVAQAICPCHEDCLSLSAIWGQW